MSSLNRNSDKYTMHIIIHVAEGATFAGEAESSLTQIWVMRLSSIIISKKVSVSR